VITILWLAAVVVGFAVTVLGSSKAVTDATQLARGTRLPPFVIGMTLLALGTDFPEIANSVVASYADHGDVNVGDSVGSAATQLTLIFGLLPFAGFAIPWVSLDRVCFAVSRRPPGSQPSRWWRSGCS
jgi:cation:H+ antiporter